MSELSAGATVGQLTHIPALDGVRAASIILVILTHTAPLGPSSWRLNEMAGPMGMSLFFCLSGFLIVSIIQRNPDVLSFLIRRSLRIVPSVVMYMAIMVLLFDITWQGVLANLLFVQNYWYVGMDKSVAPTSHLWSLGVEMHFYLAIAIATWFLGRRSVWLIFPAAVIIMALRIEGQAYVGVNTHYRVDEILSGGMLALATLYWGPQIRAFLSRPGVAPAVFVVFLGLWMLSCHIWSGPVNYARPYFTAALVGVVIHCRLPVLHEVLEGRVSAYVAKISYALYVYHPLMIFGWMNAGSDWVRYLVKRPISYVLTLIASHISTFYWEAYWQRLAKRMTAGRH